ncbi:MAG: DotU family type IV/VI secretion system protein [Holosporaceae bacterium]|jgi:type VI secretion system protein ImpK|nr:DotU family type IV/VI secretion system protein [Holosporaceae bacterium]
MPNADVLNLSNSNEIFGNFCLQVFNTKNNVKNSETNTDYKALHKSLSSILRASLLEENLSFGSDTKEIVYVMAALSDEVFLNIEWSGKEYWKENMLEQQHFGTQIAGEKIFDKINDFLMEKNPLSIKKVEVYLKTLSLGFKGKYRGCDDEEAEIDLYRRKIFNFIQQNDKSIFLISNRLFQREYTYTIPTIHRKLLPDTSIINYLCAFFIFMFTVISSTVWLFETKDLRLLLTDISRIALRE